MKDKIKLNFIIPNGYSEEITIEKEDLNLERSNQYFLDILEKEYLKYQKETSSLTKEYNKNLGKNEKSFFIPERIKKLSPMTILNAP